MQKPTCAEVSDLYSRITAAKNAFAVDFAAWENTRSPIAKETAMKSMSAAEVILKKYKETPWPWSWTKFLDKKVREFEADALRSIFKKINREMAAHLKAGMIQESQLLTDEDMRQSIAVRPGVGVIGLRLRGMSFAKLPAIVNLLENLETLALDDTPLVSLPALSHLKKLQYLRLQKTFINGTDSFDMLESLKNIDLRGSWVQDISKLAEMPNLEYLDVSGCPITTPKTSEPFKKLIRKLGKNFIFD